MPEISWKVGDRCQWTKIGGSGRTLTMVRRDGEVVAISEDGKTATVKPDGAKINVTLAIARLRRNDQRSQVTEFVDAMVANSKGG